MKRSTRRKVGVATAAALAVAGAGGAVAATQLGSPSEESKAVVDDAAAELGISPSRLSAALKNALKNRVDAAVAAGELTEEQGRAATERIEAEDYPLVFAGPRGFGHHGPGHYADLGAAATYLGLPEEQLRAEVRAGKTLADVAADRGKSVDGLVDALVAAHEERLDEAVAAGRITPEQRTAKRAGLEERVRAFVNGEGGGGPGFGYRHGPDGGRGDRFDGRHRLGPAVVPLGAPPTAPYAPPPAA